MNAPVNSTPSGPRTLATLFHLEGIEFGRRLTAAVLTTGILAPLEAQILAEVKFFPWKQFLDSLGTKAIELFQIQVDQLVVRAYEKAHVLPGDSAPAQHSARETSWVPITQKTISSDQRPRLRIEFRGQTYEIVFDLHLELVIKGLVLEVRGGKVVAIQSGSVDGSGKISLGRIELVSKDWEGIRFPGAVTFNTGVTNT
jgi:hypothetical protein